MPRSFVFLWTVPCKARLSMLPASQKHLSEGFLPALRRGFAVFEHGDAIVRRSTTSIHVSTMRCAGRAAYIAFNSGLGGLSHSNMTSYATGRRVYRTDPSRSIISSQITRMFDSKTKQGVVDFWTAAHARRELYAVPASHLAQFSDSANILRRGFHTLPPSGMDVRGPSYSYTKGSLISGNGMSAPGENMWRTNQSVEVLWNDDWWPAEIMSTTSNQVLVKFSAPEAAAYEGERREGDAEGRDMMSQHKEHTQWLNASSARLRDPKTSHDGRHPSRMVFDQYRDMLTYLQRLDDRVRFQGFHVLRWVCAAGLTAVALLMLFKEDVRKGLGEEGAEVTKRSLEDKRVQVAAEEVAKEVALQLMKNKTTIQGSSHFVKEVIDQPVTFQAAGNLVRNLYRDEEMLNHTQVWVSTIVERLCKDEVTQRNVQHLLGVAITNLYADPVMQQRTGGLVIDVAMQKEIISQTTKLLTESVHSIFEDPVVREHANSVLRQLMQDPTVRKEAAHAVWGVVATLVTLGFFTPGAFPVASSPPPKDGDGAAAAAGGSVSPQNGAGSIAKELNGNASSSADEDVASTIVLPVGLDLPAMLPEAHTTHQEDAAGRDARSWIDK